MAQHDHPEDFRSKYTKTNFASRFLLDGFFAGAGELLRQANSAEVLEVGCGEGFSTERLISLAAPAPLTAVDIEPALVEAARARNPSVEIEVASVYSLPHGDGAVELVTCMEVLEHVDSPRRALQELVRVSGRWLLLSVPREPMWRAMNMARLKYVSGLGNTPGHIQHWSRRSFLRLVGEYADVVAVRTPLPWTQVLARVR